MEQRALGTLGLEVSALGLGCMGMSMDGSNDERSLDTLRFAIGNGINFFDTADMYGWGHNEELLAKILSDYRNQVVIATKCGFILLENGERTVNGSPEHIKKSCDASLKRFNIDVIDLYYLHRADRNVPIEDSIGAMSELVEAGKVRYLGVSEVTPNTLRRAHKVHPISALQSEYSLWHRKPEKEILATCRELGIGFVPFSPLGRGFLTGKIKDTKDFSQNDFRRSLPRFQEENLKKNLNIADTIVEFAEKKNCTPAQLAIAWVLSQGYNIAPIPGTRSIEKLKENIQAVNVTLSQTDLAELNQLIPIGVVAGEQYSEHYNFEV